MLGSMSSCSARHIPTKKHSGGGLQPRSTATKVHCNPETSVGLRAALMESSSGHLHVAKPVRRSARSITLALITSPYCIMASSPFCPDYYSLLSCKLCERRMDDCIIYMYMSMGFCTEECRDEFFLEYRYRLAIAMEAESRRTRSQARKAPMAEGEAAMGDSRIFFTCADVDSFP